MDLPMLPVQPDFALDDGDEDYCSETEEEVILNLHPLLHDIEIPTHDDILVIPDECPGVVKTTETTVISSVFHKNHAEGPVVW